MIHLVLGGARSGKSSYAESLCFDLSSSINTPVAMNYIATAESFNDAEMQARIAKHQQDRTLDRNKTWLTTECPVQLPELLASLDLHQENIYLIDCLTLWINNVIYHLGEEVTQSQVASATEQLCIELTKFSANKTNHIVLVANEVGLGVVPLGSVSRLFVDNAGWLNQKIAKLADTVTLVTAGIPLPLKGNNHD